MQKELKRIKKQTMLQTAHQMAYGLHKAGIMDATTMREFDALCLPVIKKLSSKEIRKIRLLKISIMEKDDKVVRKLENQIYFFNQGNKI